MLYKKIEIHDKIGGKFEVLDILHGGNGTIFICYDHADNGIGALKTYNETLLDKKNIKEVNKKIEDEIKAWINLDKHPHIVHAVLFDIFDYRPYIHLEFVPPDNFGRNTLEQYLDSPISLKQCIEWGIQFCYAMEHATAHDIICHGDIKPSNIMITPDKILKITDFGEAKILDDLNLGKGATLMWMAPEQFFGESDIRSDLYSFGIVLYQMANQGKHPYGNVASDNNSWYSTHSTSRILYTDSKLIPIIAKCLKKNPEERYQNFEFLRKDLEYLYLEEIREAPPTPPKGLKLNAMEHSNKGLTFHRIGKVDEAIKEYEKALEINPNYTIAMNNLGMALRKIKKYDDAVKMYIKALSLEKTEETFINLGAAYAYQKKYDDAISQYKEALKLNPENAFAHSNLGIALMNNGELDDALSEVEEAIKINPKNAEFHSNLGIVLKNHILLNRNGEKK